MFAYSSSSRLKTVLEITALVLAIVMALMIFAEEKQVVSGTYFNEFDLAHLNQKEAERMIDARFESARQATIEVEVNGDVVALNPADLGINYNTEATLAAVPMKHHWFKNLLASELNTKPAVRQLNVEPVVDVDRTQLYNQLESALRTKERPASNAHLVWRNGAWDIQPEAEGHVLEDGELERIQSTLLDQALLMKESIQVAANTTVVYPTRRADELVAVKDQIDAYLNTRITVQLGAQSYSVSLSDHPSWLLVNSTAGTVEVSKDYAYAWARSFAAEHEVQAGTARITGTETVTTDYNNQPFTRAVYEGSFERGHSVDADALAERVYEAFTNPEADRTVVAPTYETAPKIVSEVEGLTFPDELGVGRSNFSLGNQPDRVTNISLSLGSFNAIVVQPGEEFSMNQTTGWITADKGYTRTKVLYGGSVGYGIGGGVCQSSTTLYRAVVHAGMPVTERRPHSLDVSYYHAYGYGIDAAVYTANRQDFKFVNDTDSPLLITTYLTDNDDAVVAFYGTSDGREVELYPVNTGVYNYKKWVWNVTKNGATDHRVIQTVY